MEKINNLIISEPGELLSTLDTYQRDIINQFLEKTSNNYLESADRWLNASPSNTALFGGEHDRSKIYRDKILEEIEKFLCGDSSYEEDRNKIVASSDNSQKYIIGLMSAAIGKSLGVAGTFIAPVIVLMIMSFGKIALNAWCAMRREVKEAKK